MREALKGAGILAAAIVEVRFSSIPSDSLFHSLWVDHVARIAFLNNKAGYTAKPVKCGWARAVILIMIFVHEGIENSAEDYNSSRMGVLCHLSCVVSNFKYGIISKRFELESFFYINILLLNLN